LDGVQAFHEARDRNAGAEFAADVGGEPGREVLQPCRVFDRYPVKVKEMKMLEVIKDGVDGVDEPCEAPTVAVVLMMAAEANGDRSSSGDHSVPRDRQRGHTLLPRIEPPSHHLYLGPSRCDRGAIAALRAFTSDCPHPCGVARAVHGALPELMAAAPPGTTTLAGALGAVLLNNLAAAVLLSARAPAHPLYLLLGLDIGPN
jgi:hypothetical protein